jgi:hypothetical protein
MPVENKICFFELSFFYASILKSQIVIIGGLRKMCLLSEKKQHVLSRIIGG